MQYLLLIYGNEAGMAAAPKEAVTQMSAAYAAYTEAMKKAGVFLGGDRLRPTSAATTVRVTNGKTNVLDGPYADTKEQLGGYYMIEVPDLDAALSWAARCPGASDRHDGSAADLADGEYMPNDDAMDRSRRDRAGGRRGGRPPQLRQAGRLSRGAHARRRRRRGCAGRAFAAALERLAANGVPDKPGSLAAQRSRGASDRCGRGGGAPARRGDDISG